jgi:FSR family fosmidomycin resistance protein-like MFS transporter
MQEIVLYLQCRIIDLSLKHGNNCKGEFLMYLTDKKPKQDDNLIKLLAISAGHFMNDFYIGIITPMLFLFAEALSLTLTQHGFIAFMFTASGTWIQPLIGHMVDKYGKTWLLIVSVIWISLWISISGLVRNYHLLVLVLVLGGISSALYHPLGSAVAIKLSSRQAGTSLSIFMTIGGFAVAVGPAVTMPIVMKFGLSKLALFMIPGVIVACLMYLAKVHNIDMSGSTVETHTEAGNDIGKEPIRPITLVWVTILTLISAVRGWLQISLRTYGAELFMLKSMDMEMFPLVLSIQLFTASFGTLVGGLLSDIIGTKKVLVLTMALTAVFLGLTIQTTGVVTMVTFILTGVLISASNSANILLTRDRLPGNATLATGLIMGLGGGMGGLGVLLQGYLGDVVGIMPSFMYLLVTVILSSILAAVLPNTAHRYQKYEL